jgi:hypothetical protein
MAKTFSLGFKSPNWSSMAVGVGKPLTNGRIRQYIKEGKYGNLRIIPAKKPKAHITKDRAIRKLVNEYATL